MVNVFVPNEISKHLKSHSCNRIPFDWKNLVGYLIVVVIEYLYGVALLFAAVTLVGFAIRNYLWLLSMAEDIKCDMESINQNARFKRSRLDVTKQFSGLVQYHAKIVQLSLFQNRVSTPLGNNENAFSSRVAKDISNLAEFIYSLLFTWSLFSICSSMMLLQMEIVEYLKGLNVAIFLQVKYFFSVSSFSGNTKTFRH